MKGVILAGGVGTRLRPLTYVSNKHLLPVYDKPMILYPLDTLRGLGITEILIISGGEHIGRFLEFMGSGTQFGVNFMYMVQKEAGGITQALALAEPFVGKEQFAVILCDNIFEDSKIQIPPKCGIVFKEILNPEGLGVFSFKEGKIIEKPKEHVSNLAQTGLYFYTHEIFDFIRTQKPSARGEMEITDLNNWCLEYLETEIIRYEGKWLDAGTFDNLLEASNWAQARVKQA